MIGTIKAGQTVVVSSGEYSDYSIHTIVIAQRDIDVDAELDAYLTLHPDERKDYAFKEYAFLSWLEERGLFVPHPVDWQELYLCSYSRAAEMTLHKWRSDA